MISFKLFFENLGQKHAIPNSPRSQRKQNQKDTYRRKAAESFSKMKDLLEKMGYVVKGEDEYTNEYGPYHMRPGKYIRMANMNKFDKIGQPKNLPKNYYKALFILAHEVGHSLQYVGDTNVQKSDFADRHIDTSYYSNRNNKYDVPTGKRTYELSKQLDIIYHEIDAWIRGLEFIPKELQGSYKEYAKFPLQGYLGRLIKYKVTLEELEDFPELGERLNVMDFNVEDLPQEFRGKQQTKKDFRLNGQVRSANRQQRSQDDKKALEDLLAGL